MRLFFDCFAANDPCFRPLTYNSIVSVANNTDSATLPDSLFVVMKSTGDQRQDLFGKGNDDAAGNRQHTVCSLRRVVRL